MLATLWLDASGEFMNTLRNGKAGDVFLSSCPVASNFKHLRCVNCSCLSYANRKFIPSRVATLANILWINITILETSANSILSASYTPPATYGYAWCYWYESIAVVQSFNSNTRPTLTALFFVIKFPSRFIYQTLHEIKNLHSPRQLCMILWNFITSNVKNHNPRDKLRR